MFFTKVQSPTASFFIKTIKPRVKILKLETVLTKKRRNKNKAILEI